MWKIYNTLYELKEHCRTNKSKAVHKINQKCIINLDIPEEYSDIKVNFGSYDYCYLMLTEDIPEIERNRVGKDGIRRRLP
jgi:hypothetical protein